jgi:5-methylcytosine-specific restriction protein A
MIEDTFQVGQVISRKRIHELFGGQQRGGISTPVKRPFIFLFTGDRGGAFGYRDYWEGDVFHYTGEGQVGDMKFWHGNKAIRDHVANGERLFLFRERSDRNQEFVGEMVLRAWRLEPREDRNAKLRQGIVFELVRV